jgi:hypothetical protein
VFAHVYSLHFISCLGVKNSLVTFVQAFYIHII